MNRKKVSSGRVRVAHISSGLEIGGLEKLLIEFARFANRDRFEMVFISLAGRGVLADRLESLGWTVRTMDAGSGFRPGLILKLARLLRQLRTNVVHTHDIRPLIYGAPAARLARIPRVIHTRHGRDFRDTRRQTTLHNLAARFADHFVCISQDNARFTVENGVSRSRVQSLLNGIDLERFSYRGPQADGPAVVVARLSPEKDIETLLRACAVVVREHPGFQLEVAGDGPCRASLEKLRRELELQRNVVFHGTVDDVPGLLARAQMFVLPSLTEGISLTLLEAMACGLPVVATRVGGNSEVVVDGETGTLVPAGDPRSLATALLTLDGDLELSWRMGLAGRRRAEQHFDVRRMVAAYESLYRGGGSQTAPATSKPIGSVPLRREQAAGSGRHYAGTS